MPADRWNKMTTAYVVDPEGDVLLHLRFSPDKPFAPWTANGSSSIAPDPASTSLGELQVTVSSKHLALASPYFNAMLMGRWLESARRADGLRHVSLNEEEGFDPNALMILMDIIHGKNKKVPRAVSLEMLAKISVLVDYFQCDESLEVWAQLWITELVESFPTSFNRNLVLWILVCSIFKYQSLFQSATQTAITDGTGPIRTLMLPISESIVGEFFGLFEISNC